MNKSQDLIDIIEDTVRKYRDCGDDLLSAILYKNIIAHVKDVGNFVHTLEQASKSEQHIKE